MLKVAPDDYYVIVDTDGLFLRRLLMVPFAGPGLYLSDMDTVLVVPNERCPDTAWDADQPDGTIYTAYIWRCRARLIAWFGGCRIPIRADARERPRRDGSMCGRSMGDLNNRLGGRP